MKTQLKSIHEEGDSDGKFTFGVLLNYNDEGFKESFIFIFKHEKKMYIFFNTMFDMFNYQLNGAFKVKCAYMPEEDFDKYGDAPYIEGKFTDLLSWT
jgi:hypothetical protein